MRSRIGFDKAQFEALAQLWNKNSPEKYAVDAEIIRLNTVDCKVFDWGASVIELEDGAPIGFTIVKKSPAPLYSGPDPDSAYLSAIVFDNPTTGVDLLSYVKKLLRNRGAHKLIFGSDTRHFYPGCPTDFPALRDFLTIEGFEESGEQYDVERDLTEYVPNPKVLGPLASYPGHESEVAGPRVEPLTNDFVEETRRFLNAEFPGRWTFDVMAKVEAESDLSNIYILRIGDRVEGFAVTQVTEDVLPIAGAVWRASLGEKWGSLGPIGVSKDVRGRGLGDALLAASLLGLKLKGTRQCLIDWTTLLDFYGKHGFECTRIYRAFTLNLI